MARHIDLAFAIYSKNVPKLGRGKNSRKNKLVKRLRFAWARLFFCCGLGQVPGMLDELSSTHSFCRCLVSPDLQNNMAFAGIE